MAMNKATRAALKALSYPDLDIKKSYKAMRKLDRIASRRLEKPRTCDVSTIHVEREGYQIPVRVYTPLNGRAKGVVLFFHGGGWVSGDIDTYQGVCIDMQETLSRTVVSVDYRRAPEFKFPYAPEDCYAVAKSLFAGELISGATPENIILLGDSAGGNLAAVVSIMAKERGDFRPKNQILIYPATADDHSPSSPFASIRENGTDYMLTSKRVTGYMELYAEKPEDLKNPHLAPLLAKDLSGQPRTLIITAEYCPLRDEGEEYGRRLTDSGNFASVYRMPDAIHGYFSLPVNFKIVRDTYNIIKRFLGDDKIAESAASWTKLDNAAKIFPPTTSRHDAKVFRVYCELVQRVDGHLLQMALDEALKEFPFFCVVLKKGVFWYYFEDSYLSPIVREEYKEPCSPLYDSHRKELLFEVTYYKKRVNFEVYHALTDGAGAVMFLQTLIANYLKKSFPKDIPDVAVFQDNDASMSEKKDDSFYHYYTDKKFSRVKGVSGAYHIRGARLGTPHLGIIEGEMPIQQVIKKAHEYNATVTVFLMSLFIRAIAEGMAAVERHKSVVIDVPVDLRRYFDSKSVRNFFEIIDICCDFSKMSHDLEGIIEIVASRMKDSLERENVIDLMATLSKIGNIMPARMTPLFLKAPGLKMADRFLERGVTAAFSNLGSIKMPPELSPYIAKFGVISSTKRMQACMCSYEGSFVICFSSPFVTTDVQCRFFRALTEMGIDVSVTSNLGSDNNVVL